VVFLSVYDAFVNVKMEAKQTIFIPGGAGGVGHMAVQLAKTHGLTVITSGGNEASFTLLKSYHADHIIDYKKHDVVAEIMKLTGNKGVDMVYDCTYQPKSFVESAKVLKSGGDFMVLGPNAAPESDHMKILTEKKAHVVVTDLVPLSAPNVPEEVKKNRLTKGLIEANKLMEQGKIKPNICKTLFLNEVIDEMVALHNGAPALPGKVVGESSYACCYDG